MTASAATWTASVTPAGSSSVSRRRPPNTSDAPKKTTSTQSQVGRPTAQAAATESTGGSRVATDDQLAPASPEPNTSPDVAPK
jgi:hypothetical protein